MRAKARTTSSQPGSRHLRAIWTPQTVFLGPKGFSCTDLPLANALLSGRAEGPAVRLQLSEGPLAGGRRRTHLAQSEPRTLPRASPTLGSISNPLLTFKHTHEMLRVSYFLGLGLPPVNELH